MTVRPEAAPMAEPWASRTPPCAPRRPNQAEIGTWTAYDWDNEACFVYREGMAELGRIARSGELPTDVARALAAYAQACFTAAQTAATIANGLRR
jgi:hypothetical protein